MKCSNVKMRITSCIEQCDDVALLDLTRVSVNFVMEPKWPSSIERFSQISLATYEIEF
jgi:hypothetical protein